MPAGITSRSSVGDGSDRARVGLEAVAGDLDRLDPLRRRGSRPARRGSEAGSSAACPLGSRAAKSRRTSKLRFTIGVAASSSASLAGSSSRSAGSTTTSAPASSPSSAAPAVVHDACAGPRRPSDDDVAHGRMPTIASIAGSIVSVGASSSACQREHAGDVERDVAVADHDGALDREVERAPGSPGGRCTRRRTPSPTRSPADPRRGCPSRRSLCAPTA